MRKIKSIDVHCSATSHANYSLDREYIRKIHVEQNGWDDIGYHWIVCRDGLIQKGRPMGKPGAHVKGHNQDSVGVCLMGGLDDFGHAVEGFDYYAESQKIAFTWLIDWIMREEKVPAENVKGHRDHSPDLNHDGIITPDEWLKDCPCFSVATFMQAMPAVLRRIEFMGYEPPIVL